MSKIMVVEDESHIQRLIQVLLTRSGHQVELFNDGRQALERLSNKELPDLVLLDIIMPEVDGLQVLTEIRKDKNRKKLPVAFLSSLTQESIVKKGIALGIKDYIRKPFHPKDLMVRVEKALNQVQTS